MATHDMTRESLLAYVFWHWRQASAERGTYEAAQQAFHRVLAASPSAGSAVVGAVRGDGPLFSRSGEPWSRRPSTVVGLYPPKRASRYGYAGKVSDAS